MALVRILIDKFQRSEFAKNTVILTIGTLIAQGISIAAMPILSRLYNPADFGQLAVFVAVSGIVATAITLRFEAAILIPKDDGESKALVLLSAFLATFFGMVVGLAAWLMPDTFKYNLGLSKLDEWLVVSILCGMTIALITIGLNWYNRQRSYIKMTTLRVTQSSVSVVLGLSFGLWGFHGGMMLGQIVASLIVTVMLLVGLRGLREGWRSHDFPAVIKRHRSSPKYLLPTSLLDVFTLQLPVLMISNWFSNEEAGHFSMAWKMLAIPSALIGTAVGQVFLQQFSKTWPDAHAARQLLFKTWKVLALVGLLPTVLVVLFGANLFGWVLGDAWRGAGSIAMVIAPMLYAMLISSPTSGTFLILGIQRFSLLFGISSLFYRPISIWVGFVNNSLLLGLLLFVIFEIIQISIYQFLVIRKIDGVREAAILNADH